MRIAYFNATMKTGQDGVTRVLFKIFEEAMKRGHEVIAFGASLPPKSERPPVKIIRVPSVSLPLQRAYRVALPGYSMFAKRLKDWKPDIVHIHSPCTLGFAAARYARDHGAAAVATYHTHFPTYLRYYNLTRFEARTWKLLRHLYNSLDATFVPSIPVMEELREHNIRRTEYLPNGVDLTMFSAEHKRRKWRTDVGAGSKPVVLFVSRLVWEKNLRVLAEAYSMLRAKKQEFTMVVVGDGHSRRDLERLMPGAVRIFPWPTHQATSSCSHRSRKRSGW
jgi:phosphatidylinositol alpha 1,6-mannosyltransferase